MQAPEERWQVGTQEEDVVDVVEGPLARLLRGAHCTSAARGKGRHLDPRLKLKQEAQR